MSDPVFCRQCGVNDDEQAMCNGCEEMFPHADLIHYDFNGVYCQECDEWVDEIYEDEEAYEADCDDLA